MSFWWKQDKLELPPSATPNLTFRTNTNDPYLNHQRSLDLRRSDQEWSQAVKTGCLADATAFGSVVNHPRLREPLFVYHQRGETLQSRFKLSLHHEPPSSSSSETVNNQRQTTMKAQPTLSWAGEEDPTTLLGLLGSYLITVKLRKGSHSPPPAGEKRERDLKEVWLGRTLRTKKER